MGKTFIKFGNIEIAKQKCHQHKRPISMKKIDINKIIVSNKVSFSIKGSNISLATKMLKKIRPLCKLFPKVSAYRRDFDETKYIAVLEKDDELL